MNLRVSVNLLVSMIQGQASLSWPSVRLVDLRWDFRMGRVKDRMLLRISPLLTQPIC